MVAELIRVRVGQLRGLVGKATVINALSEDFKEIARASRAIGLDEPDFPVALYGHPRTKVETPVTTHADALLELLEEQEEDIVTRLDAAFLNKYRSNPAKIAAWKAASRVERAPRKSDTPPAVPTP